MRFLDPNSIQDRDFLTEYARLCQLPCSFPCPGCDDDEYVHLPAYVESQATTAATVFSPPTLVPSQKELIPELRNLVRRFCYHREGVTARDVVQYLSSHFPSMKLSRLMLCVLQRIMDDERRATLLLAYSNMYPRVSTMCCNAPICFNCKRELDADSSAKPCKCLDDRISGDNCVQCRSCRVLLVKVEGCNEVRCACGFTMDWENELELQRLGKRSLLSVDAFGTTLVE